MRDQGRALVGALRLGGDDGAGRPGVTRRAPLGELGAVRHVAA
jgi:hypothetical protein